MQAPRAEKVSKRQDRRTSDRRKRAAVVAAQGSWRRSKEDLFCSPSALSLRHASVGRESPFCGAGASVQLHD